MNNVIQCMVVFIEWFYQASLPKHTEGTLVLMNEFFWKFNKLKDVFVNVSLSSLKFPKMHMLTHFEHFIRRYGTLDNMDTEIKNMHIFHLPRYHTGAPTNMIRYHKLYNV